MELLFPDLERRVQKVRFGMGESRSSLFTMGSVSCPSDIQEAIRVGSSGVHGIWSSTENSGLEIDIRQLAENR